MTSEQKNENKRSSGIKAMNLLTQIASELNSYSQEPNYQYAIEFLDNRELGLAFEYFGELALKNRITSPSVLEKLYQVGLLFDYPNETGVSKEFWNAFLNYRQELK